MTTLTWRQLATLATEMLKVQHTSLDNPVLVIFDGSYYPCDIHESLFAGDAFITCDIYRPEPETEEETDGDTL